MLPKISDVVKEGLKSLQIFLWHPGTSWSLRNPNFCKKIVKKTRNTGTPPPKLPNAMICRGPPQAQNLFAYAKNVHMTL